MRRVRGKQWFLTTFLIVAAGLFFNGVGSAAMAGSPYMSRAEIINKDAVLHPEYQPSSKAATVIAGQNKSAANAWLIKSDNSQIKEEIRLAVLSANSLMYQVVTNIGYTLDNAIVNYDCKLSGEFTAPLKIGGSRHDLHMSGRVKLFDNQTLLDCDDLLNSDSIFINKAEVIGQGYVKGSELNSNFEGDFWLTGTNNFLLKGDIFQGIDIADYALVNGSGSITDTVYAGHQFPDVSGNVNDVKVDVAAALDLLDRILSADDTLTLGDVAIIAKQGDVYAHTSDCQNIHMQFNGTYLIDVDSTCTSPTHFQVNLEAGEIIAKPNSPSQLSAIATTSSSIVLAWKDNSSDETGFKIERKEGACDSANAWSLIATKGANVTTHTNTGLTPNTTYSYRVRAYNASGNSAYSNCGSAKTALSGTPNAPTNLNATSISSSQIKLLWTDNSTDEKSFKIHRKAGAGSWSLLATKGANIVSHTDTGATGNTSTTTYSYYVQACNSNGCSPKTSTAIVPYEPADLNATVASLSEINLTWTDKSGNETGFEVERKIGGCLSTNPWSRIKTVGQNIESCSNTGLASGKTYSYRVRAYKKSSATPYAYGYSSYSNCKSAKIP